MVALPVDTTARLFVDYTTGASQGVSHTLQLRYVGSDRTGAAAQARIAAVLNALGGATFRQGWKVQAVRTALAGETFTLPQAPVSALDNFIGTSAAAYSRWTEARELTYVGRAVDSPRRVRLSFFGLSPGLATMNAFRYVLGTGNGTYDASINALRAANDPSVTIDGRPVSWYPYINMNFNSYWERRLRVS